MEKVDLKMLGKNIVDQFQETYGKNMQFSYIKSCKSNSEPIGIRLKFPNEGSFPVLVLGDDLGSDPNKDAVNDEPYVFQDMLREDGDFGLLISKLSKEYVLNNVVFRVVGRKYNHQLLKSCPYVRFLDLAGIFALPVGEFDGKTLFSMIITNKQITALKVTIDELTETARQNTLRKFGVCLFPPDGSQKPFDEVEMTACGLYALTNNIKIDGAALILIPEVLEKIGEKAGMDYFVLPGSTRVLSIIKDDGAVTAKLLKEVLYESNRDSFNVRRKEFLSDSVYRYSRKKKVLNII